MRAWGWCWGAASPGYIVCAHLQLSLHEPDLLVLLGQLVQEEADGLHALGVRGGRRRGLLHQILGERKDEAVEVPRERLPLRQPRSHPSPYAPVRRHRRLLLGVGHAAAHHAVHGAWGGTARGRPSASGLPHRAPRAKPLRAHRLPGRRSPLGRGRDNEGDTGLPILPPRPTPGP